MEGSDVVYVPFKKSPKLGQLTREIRPLVIREGDAAEYG